MSAIQHVSEPVSSVSRRGRQPTRHSPSVNVFRKLRGQVLQHVQSAVGIGRIGREVDRADDASLFPSVLGSGRAVQVDENVQTDFVGPFNGLDEMWVLRMVSLKNPIERGNVLAWPDT